MILALIFAALVGMIVGLYFYRRSSMAMRTIASTISEVSRGQLNARIPAIGWGFGETTGRINTFLDHVQNLSRSLHHSSAEIAHTLKRPLIRLRRRLESAREAELNRGEFIELVDGSLAEIDSMVGIFEAILDLAQIEGGNFRQRFTEVDLKSVLLKLIDVYEAVIQDSGQTLIVELDELMEAPISGDSDLLFQLFSSLIENAILYCPTATNIRVRLTANAHEFVAMIADNGPGLSEEDRNNVFRPFFRPDSTQKSPGHGLGIPFVAAITRLHGARITLEDNAPGLRAVVHFAK
jgi:signal transduction histidine kinase